jgi:hypothetical protein
MICVQASTPSYSGWKQVQVVSFLEGGRATPISSKARLISAALGCSMRWMVKEQGQNIGRISILLLFCKGMSASLKLSGASIITYQVPWRSSCLESQASVLVRTCDREEGKEKESV